MSSNTAGDEYPRVEQLLDQWARWRSGGLGELGYGSIAHRYEKRELPSVHIEHDDPAFDNKMLDIGRCVGNLPPDYRAAVLSYHCAPEHVSIKQRAAPTVRQRAEQLEIAVQTYYRRLRAGYAELALMKPFR